MKEDYNFYCCILCNFHKGQVLDVVAGPIGDALVATAIGIAVAVPAVLAYNFALRQLKIQRSDMENFVATFMTVALTNKS